MLKIFEKLFASATNANSAFAQTEREATVDLLLLAIYADNHISLDESSALEDSIEGLGWESGTGVAMYVNTATPQVRDAQANETAQNEFLDGVAARLGSTAAREKALSLLNALFEADGTSVEEESFYKLVQTKLTAGA